MSRNTILAFVSIGLLGVTACEKPQPVKTLPPKVLVAKPLKRDVPEYRYFTGRADAKDSVDIRARVEGFLQEVRFEDGQEVKEGDILFVIEQEPYETSLLAAKARLQQSEAQLKLADANVRRTRQLLKKNAVTVEEADQREADVLIATAQIALNQQQVRHEEIEFNYTIVKSPISGTAGRHLVTPGNLVGVGEKTLLTTVVRMDPIEVFFDVSENILNSVLRRYHRDPRKDTEARTPAELGLGDEEGYSHRGVVNFLENRIDPSTGTILVRAEFENKDHLLYPGQYVRIRIPLPGSKNALLVKESALSTDLGGKYLLVLDKENKVQRRYVELGSTYGDMRVVTKGITESESYIAKGILRARPGFPVQAELIEVKPEGVIEDPLKDAAIEAANAAASEAAAASSAKSPKKPEPPNGQPAPTKPATPAKKQ